MGFLLPYPVPHNPVSTPNKGENHRFAVTRAMRRSGTLLGIRIWHVEEIKS